MKKRKVMVALGGNAILTNDASAQAQQEALRKTAKHLVEFLKHGDDLVIAHGNGPQVGNLLLQQAAGSTEANPAMPIDTTVAMTEGSIGYWLENAMDEELAKAGIDKHVGTVVTQVEVSPDDPAFLEPTKPIGPFYTAEQVKDQQANHPDYQFMEDANRGWRRVVPSPRPLNIAETEIIRSVLDAGNIPVAVGGGGIPVVRKGQRLEGREAVIDKDFASEKLAELLEVDVFIILTAVDNIYVNFGTPEQTALTNVTVAQLENYMQEDQFAKGSMLPKVQAVIEFMKATEGTQAIVTSLKNISNYLRNGSGTIINK
ncbi:carbamate kinase [Limosilactobacillus fermentum]|uniref:carbamate kinase n=1 Tax=Limosilactobacillus fermentum TaxID=1613 RepID=UPI001075E6C0|nr:carbamate kinase [Limosilactobacillus fermentum]TFZ17017.1 carbamate kinase [Limosilactobacillus fermentum]